MSIVFSYWASFVEMRLQLKTMGSGLGDCKGKTGGRITTCNVTAKEDTGIVQSGGFSERHGGLLDAFSRWSAL